MTGVQTCALPISTRKRLELINEFGNVAGYKINAHRQRTQEGEVGGSGGGGFGLRWSL